MYRILYDPRVQKDVKGLPETVRQRVKAKLEWLSQNYDKIIPVRLKGKAAHDHPYD